MASSSPKDDLDAKHGFSRPEMHTADLAGTVQLYERHVFLCYKQPECWPSHLETSEQDHLPRNMAAFFKARKADMFKKTRLTICGGDDGDILMFPDMIHYKGLTNDNVESFGEEVLIREQEWSVNKPTHLVGSFVFVCCHGNRDMRCGVCGPALIQSFQDEIFRRGLGDEISVRPCSHVGGHKYAGNVIIYSSNTSGEIEGHWYGYVTPKDVGVLLVEHIGKHKSIHGLWRGQMGLNEEEQKSAFEALKHTNEPVQNGGSSCLCTQQWQMDGAIDPEVVGFGCCQNKRPKVMGKVSRAWYRAFDGWQRGDTLAAIAVVAAVVAVAAAFRLSRSS